MYKALTLESSCCMDGLTYIMYCWVYINYQNMKEQLSKILLVWLGGTGDTCHCHLLVILSINSVSSFYSLIKIE